MALSRMQELERAKQIVIGRLKPSLRKKRAPGLWSRRATVKEKWREWMELGGKIREKIPISPFAFITPTGMLGSLTRSEAALLTNLMKAEKAAKSAGKMTPHLRGSVNIAKRFLREGKKYYDEWKAHFTHYPKKEFHPRKLYQDWESVLQKRANLASEAHKKGLLKISQKTGNWDLDTDAGTWSSWGEEGQNAFKGIRKLVDQLNK